MRPLYDSLHRCLTETYRGIHQNTVAHQGPRDRLHRLIADGELDIDMVCQKTGLSRGAVRARLRPSGTGTVQGSRVTALAGLGERDEERREPSKRDPYLEPVGDSWDTAGQAGMIKSFVKQMPGEMRRHLLSKYALGRERARAQGELVAYVTPVLTCSITARRIVRLMVGRFYGRDVTLVAVAEQFKLRRARLGELNRQVAITLDALGVRAESAAYKGLKEQGVIA